jgi:hypothetical protein
MFRGGPHPGNRPAIETGRVRAPDFLRTSTFRLAALYALTFSAATAVLFGFIYWQTALYQEGRIDAFLVAAAKALAAEPRERLEQAVSLRIVGDLRRIGFAGLFDAEGHRIMGNLAEIPAGLPTDGRAHEVSALQITDAENVRGPVRAVARQVGDGSVIVITRNIEQLRDLRALIVRALELGVIPEFLLAVFAGAFISWRAQIRARAVHHAAQRILRGNLVERLPTLDSGDDFDRLARTVNRMLDEIMRLVETLRGVGNDVAHDLQTPLGRLRLRLERALQSGGSAEVLQRVVQAAIQDLDQTLALITTLLRIGEIESGQRRRSFAKVELGELLTDLAESYEPVAEEKDVLLTVEAAPELATRADRGLLMEAIANLLQNAIKFTPPGGRVALSSRSSPDGPVIVVADTGPGIPPDERERIFDRFYRLDKSRSVEGHGLGLSLVASIVALHGFRIEVKDAAPGAIFEITCRGGVA